MNEHSNFKPGQHYIEATTSLVDKPLRTLKDEDLFAVFDTQGDINAHQPGTEGLYYNDTRFQSRLLLRIGGTSPLLLGSSVLEDNGALVSEMTNHDLRHENGSEIWLPRDSVFASRLKILSANTCFDRILIRRFDAIEQPLKIDLEFGCDFADLFEVRGEKREHRGELRTRCVNDREVRFSYFGLDGLERTTSIQFNPPPDVLTTASAHWDLDLSIADKCAIVVTTVCAMGEASAEVPSNHIAAFRAYRRKKATRRQVLGEVTSSNEFANEVLRRATSDISMLVTNTEHGPYPYAGVPWYSTVFGRDGIITAMEMLWIAPEIARGVLNVLAATQATETDDKADSEPGKIIHEMRAGEMARLGEVPFRRYYGTIDATPLFVWLAGEYFKRSGDIATIRAIWPNIEAALAWIDDYGDRDGDGFVEYARQTEQGLANQGWKDSHDSIFHEDGRDAVGPIALCEVQAYAYAAKRAGAELALALEQPARANELNRSAERLRIAFEEKFWLEDLGTYALALDGEKRPCRVLASNAGHALLAGIASQERAERVANLLTGNRFFTGWGIRTLASGEARYNPMSYHNGSVWPHDNAVIALGFARYGLNTHATKILEGLLDAAAQLEFSRLPELFCGFQRRRGRGPTPYPVACAPQAWAAAAPFALLQAATGLRLHHDEGSIYFNNPILPSIMGDVVLSRLQLADSQMTIQLLRSDDEVVATILERQGAAKLVITR